MRGGPARTDSPSVAGLRTTMARGAVLIKPVGDADVAEHKAGKIGWQRDRHD